MGATTNNSRLRELNTTGEPEDIRQKRRELESLERKIGQKMENLLNLDNLLHLPPPSAFAIAALESIMVGWWACGGTRASATATMSRSAASSSGAAASSPAS